VNSLKLVTGPVLFLVSWLLFGVYEIGYSIEDPFQGTLRLSVLCDGIRRDVLADDLTRSTAFKTEEKPKEKPYKEEDDYAASPIVEETSEVVVDETPVVRKRDRKTSIEPTGVVLTEEELNDEKDYESSELVEDRKPNGVEKEVTEELPRIPISRDLAP